MSCFCFFTTREHSLIRAVVYFFVAATDSSSEYRIAVLISAHVHFRALNLYSSNSRKLTC